LSEKILDLARVTADKFHLIFQQEGQELTLRNQVMIGLWRKLYLAFESLVEDARRGRSESCHHLKTMMECVICLHYIDKEPGDGRANLVLAESARQKKKFFKNNPEFPHWDIFLENYTEKYEYLTKKCENKEKLNLKKLAEEDKERDGFYKRAFMMACEPSHITDLSEYMPRLDGVITLAPPEDSIRWALIAFYWGIAIMCRLLKSLSTLYDFGLDNEIDNVKNKLECINRDAWGAKV
jgi:hypothetical protein